MVEPRSDGQDGCLPTHRRRPQPLKTGITTHRFGGHGASQERISGQFDGGLQPDSAWHRAESRWRVAVYPSRTHHWWRANDKAPPLTPCRSVRKSQCSFSTADSENPQIPQYKYSVVMGVKAKVPGKGSAFFFHTTDGGPSRGLCGDRRCHAGADHPLAAAWCA